MAFKLNKLPAITVAINALDDLNHKLPNWAQKIVDITEKPEVTGGIAAASLISYLLSGGDTKMYICKDSNIEYKLSTYSRFDVGILGTTIGLSALAKLSGEFCEKYYQLSLVGLSVFEFVCEITSLSDYGTTEILYNNQKEVVYEGD
jgi:hypothetical protein